MNRATTVFVFWAALAAASSVRAADAPPPAVVEAPGAPTGFIPGWSVDARAGAALPLGAQSKDNGAGGLGGVDLLYQATHSVDLDLMGLFAAMPYTAAGGGAPAPMTVAGLAFKADFTVFRSGASKAWLGAGLGYLDLAGTGHAVQDPGTYPVTYATTNQNSAGLALLACAGAAYAFAPRLSAAAELDVLSLDAAGGTSNNLLAALPNLSLRWAF